MLVLACFVRCARLQLQVVGYSLAKPAKEVLFTVVPREDMYRAKLCIDTLVVRGGDVLAAAAFHILEGLLHFGAPLGNGNIAMA